MTRLAAHATAALLLAGIGGQAQQHPTFFSRAVGVRVDALVTDGRKPVAGLTAQDFELRDNGVLQSVDVTIASDVPLNAVLAFDTSASVQGKRRRDLIDAGDTFLDGLKPVDRASLLTFSRDVAPRVRSTTDFAAVRTELDRIAPGGLTSLMDGVYAALTVALAQTDPPLVLVCTDGTDTSSWLDPREVLEAAKRSNAVIYAVTSADARRSTSLADLANATGGQILSVKSSAELSTTFRRILQEFRSRYILTYSPTGVRAGGFHAIDIRVKRRGLVVRARPGYVGLESGS
ncbi:MAG TPA: VWA domain-containing protein [Vicinamibacterales bacterium]